MRWSGRIFTSRLTDPFLNLSIEHYLFKNLPVDSTRLFLYTNDPCVVVGRNQNPWRECNVPLLNSLKVPLVRRRSGGGTVVHDRGNVNFSFMVPRSSFARDTHALLVIDAVNKMSDPVAVTVPNKYDESDLGELSGLDVAPPGTPFEMSDSLSTGDGTIVSVPGPQVKLKLNSRFDIVTKEPIEKKVSGSAFKIERQRAYHHGTMLLNSRLDVLSSLLHRDVSRLGIVKGSGVESVKSPVANIGCDPRAFEQAVVDEFRQVYECEEEPLEVIDSSTTLPDEVLESANEMQTWDWAYGSTPKFTHSFTHPELDISVQFSVNKGVITDVNGLRQGQLIGCRYNSQDIASRLDEKDQHLGSWIVQSLDGLSPDPFPFSNPVHI